MWDKWSEPAVHTGTQGGAIFGSADPWRRVGAVEQAAHSFGAMNSCAHCGAPFNPMVDGQTVCDRCQGLAHPEPSSPLQLAQPPTFGKFALLCHILPSGGDVIKGGPRLVGPE